MAESRVAETTAPGPWVESFDEFWRRDHRAVLGLAAALCGDWSAAEDLTQDAFLSAQRSWDRIVSPSAWVRRVVVNRAVSRRRRLAREAAALVRLAGRTEPVVLGEEPDGFWDAVRGLPARQAKVVVLYYLEDRPVADIAVLLGLAAGTVKATLSAARRNLARQLNTDEDH